MSSPGLPISRAPGFEPISEAGATRLSAWLGRLGAWGAVWVGIAAGVAGAYVSDLEMAWIGFLMVAAFCVTVLLATRDIVRLVGGLLIFTLQADAAYRVLYGRAGSDGLAFPLCVIVAAAWVLLWWLMTPIGERRTIDWGRPLLVPLALMFGAMFVAIAFSGERFVGVTALLYHLELYLVFWVVLQMVQTKADLERVLRLLLVVLAIQCVIYFIQSALGVGFNLEGDKIEQGTVPRPGGTVSSNPAGFASFAIPILMVAMARFLMSARRYERRYLAVLIAMGVTAVGLTFTRVAWAGLLVSSAMLVMTTWRRGFLPTRGIVWIAVALAITLAALAPGILYRNEEAPLDEAYSERHGLMLIALEIIREHPLTGVGPGAYAYVYKRHLPENLGDQWLYKVHNEYLLRTAESGIAGGIAWVLLLVTGFRLARQLSRIPVFAIQTLGLGWSAGILALAWQMYWVPWDGFQYNVLLWVFLALTIAAQRIVAREEAGDALR